VRAAIGAERLQALLRLDNRTNVLYLLGDWTLIALAVLLGVRGDAVWTTVVAIVVIGSRQRALMNLVHQASHGQLFAGRRRNDWAGRLLTAAPLGMSLRAYKRSHLRHHRHLWDGAADPKFKRYKRLGLVEPGRRASEYVLNHVMRPLLLIHVPFNLKAGIALRDSDRTELLTRLVLWAAVAAVVLLLGLEQPFLLYWLVPYLTTFQILRYWAEAAEHAGLRSDDPWMATRSWTATPLVRWMLAPHSDSYHLAHHIVAGVPHYRLRVLHRELLRLPEYARAHHCDGFLFSRRPDAPSVILDMCWPERLARYRPHAAAQHA
jgi:fatty acid desaturase